MTLFPTLAATGQSHFHQGEPEAAGVMASLIYAGEVATLSSNATRRAEFLAGRKAAAEALARAGYEAADSCYIGRNTFGAPQWPTGWTGSITHSKGTYIAIAAKSEDYLAIGVDVETLRGGDMDRAIARICMVPGDDNSAEPTLIFSAKESIYKACHPLIGGNLWFTDFTVSRFNVDGSFSWQFNPDPTINGQGQYQMSDSNILTCVALAHGHALSAYGHDTTPITTTTPKKEFA